MTDDIDRDRPQTEPSPPALNLAPAPHLTPVPDQATPPDQTVPGTVERPAGRAQLTLLVAGICMPVLGSALISPVLPQMQRHFHNTPGSDVLVPMVVALPGLFLALSAPLLGSVADRTNRKALLLIAVALYAVVGSAPLYLASLVAIAVSRVLLGACEGVILICCTSLIGDYWTGARRAKYLSVSTLATSLAATAFLAVGGVLGVSGWRTPFWMYVLPLLLLVPMARLLWQPPRTSTPGVGTRLEPLPRRQVLVPCLVTLFGGLYFFTLVVELPFILDGIGIHSTAAVGTISAVMALATAAGSALFPRLAARPARVLVPLEFAGVAVGLATVFATGALPVVVTGAIITGFSTGVMLPTLLVWAIHRLNYSQRGRGTGWWSGALNLGQFFCPLVVAGLSTASGGLQPALGVLALAAALLAATVLLGLRHQHDPLDPSPGEPVTAPAAP
ncbi:MULTISPECIES: MFS transporter [unclassified Streptomyces]|uniref:MFS transporter n=2 Tax=Streptomyces TaxID=1883 RepID=UPI000689C91D|nr:MULTISPECIES: MFS transporter [unclassified Streptomyces]